MLSNSWSSELYISSIFEKRFLYIVPSVPSNQVIGTLIDWRQRIVFLRSILDHERFLSRRDDIVTAIQFHALGRIINGGVRGIYRVDPPPATEVDRRRASQLHGRLGNIEGHLRRGNSIKRCIKLDRGNTTGQETLIIKYRSKKIQCGHDGYLIGHLHWGIGRKGIGSSMTYG